MEHWAIWAAVSSEKQADDDKTSLPDQLSQGRAFVAGRGGAVVREFQVVHSRSDLLFEQAKQEMPEYANLEQLCERKTITHLWCRGWDRIARCEAVSGAVSYLLRSAGVQVYSARAGILTDPDTLAGALTSSIERIQAQQEIRELTRRYRDGMKGRILGRKVATGTWPTGYTPVRDDGGRVIGAEFNDDIAKVQRITDLYLDDGLGYNSIRQQLEAEAIPSPSGRPYWGVSTIHKILHNPTYAGYPHSGDVIAAEPSTAYPALWDAETWRRIQARQSKNRPGGRPPASQASGRVICEVCKYRMRFNRARTKSGYTGFFGCVSKNKRGMRNHPPNYIREQIVLDAIEARIAQLATDKAIDTLLTQEQAVTDDGCELARLRGVVESIGEKRVALGRKSLSGEIPGDVARELHLELSDQLEAAAQRIAVLEQAEVARPTQEQRRATMLALRDLAGRAGWLRKVPIPRVLALFDAMELWVYVEGGGIIAIDVGTERRR